MWKIQKRREGGGGARAGRENGDGVVCWERREGPVLPSQFSLSLTHSCCCLCLYNFITLQCGSRRFLLSRFFFSRLCRVCSVVLGWDEMRAATYPTARSRSEPYGAARGTGGRSRACWQPEGCGGTSPSPSPPPPPAGHRPPHWTPPPRPPVGAPHTSCRRTS